MQNLSSNSFLYQNRKKFIVILVFVLLGVGWHYWTKPEVKKEYGEINKALNNFELTMVPLGEELKNIQNMDNPSYEEKQRYVEIVHAFAIEGQVFCRNLRNEKNTFKHLPDEYLDRLNCYLDALENFSIYCSKIPSIGKENLETWPEAMSHWQQEGEQFIHNLEIAESELFDCAEKYGLVRRSK